MVSDNQHVVCLFVRFQNEQVRFFYQQGPQYIGDPEGFATKFALAGSLMHPLSMDLVEGYHFNHHLFLGAGVGLRCLGSEPSIPVYVDFTINVGYAF